MRALITGANGQLGTALRALLPNAIATDAAELDITNAAQVADFDYADVDVIINAAAFTNVDGAEQDDRLGLSWNVNANAVANLAAAARKHDIPLVHISTDYVFDGEATTPYIEDYAINPQGMYGVTKAGGEMAARIAPKHYLIRTAWVYGEGPNFVRTMLKLAETRDELQVVDDQKGRPTYAPDLAQTIIDLLEKKAPYGTYHCTNAGDEISWAEFATAIFETANLKCTVAPVSTATYTADKPNIAPRPTYSVLSLDKLSALELTPRDWRAALTDYLKKETS